MITNLSNVNGRHVFKYKLKKHILDRSESLTEWQTPKSILASLSSFVCRMSTTSDDSSPIYYFSKPLTKPRLSFEIPIYFGLKVRRLNAFAAVW